MRGLEYFVVDLCCIEESDGFCDDFSITRENTVFRAIDRSKVDVQTLECCLHFRFCSRDTEHLPGRQCLHERTTQTDEAQGILERDYLRNSGSDVFAHAVAHHGHGLHALCHKLFRQRILYHKQERLCIGRLVDEGCLFFCLWEEGCFEVECAVLCKCIEAVINDRTETWLSGVEVCRHVCVLCSLTGKEEYRTGSLQCGGLAPACRVLHFLQEVCLVSVGNRPALAQWLSSSLQGICNRSKYLL